MDLVLRILTLTEMLTKREDQIVTGLLMRERAVWR